MLTKDYSNPDNLKAINTLPKITIKEDGIDETGCEEFGNYTIKGTIEGEGLNNAKGVIIPFSSPDSSGLCDIEVNGDDVTLKCHNKEKFEVSRIIFGKTIIQDSNKTEIFILNSHFNKKSFACAISVNSSTIINRNSTISSIPSSNPSSSFPSSSSSKSTKKSNAFRYFTNNNSSGLTGGVIIGIIVSVVAALAIVTGLAIYCKGRNKKFATEDSTLGIDSDHKYL